MKILQIGIVSLLSALLLAIPSSAFAANVSTSPAQVMQDVTQTISLPAPETSSKIKSALLDARTQSAKYTCRKKSANEVKAFTYYVQGGAEYTYCDGSNKSLTRKVVGINFSATVKTIGADLLKEKVSPAAKAGAAQRITATKTTAKIAYDCNNRSRESIKMLSFTNSSVKSIKCPKATINSSPTLQKNN